MPTEALIRQTPEFRLPDGHEHEEGSRTIPIGIPERISLVADALLGLNHIVRILHGDELKLPEDYRGRESIGDIAGLIARRHDRLYTRIKIEAHKRQRGRERDWVALDGALAVFGGIIGVVSTLTGNPVWDVVEGVVAERLVVHAVDEIEEDDRIHDEEGRIRMVGRKVGVQLHKDIMEAARQAGITDEVGIRDLAQETLSQIRVRRDAFDRFNTPDREGRNRLNEAIAVGVDLYEADRRLYRGERAPIHPQRRINRLKERVMRLEDFAVSFHIEQNPPRYVSFAQLVKEERERTRQATPGRWPWRR